MPRIDRCALLKGLIVVVALLEIGMGLRYAQRAARADDLPPNNPGRVQCEVEYQRCLAETGDQVACASAKAACLANNP